MTVCPSALAVWIALLAWPASLSAADPAARLVGEWVATYQGNKPISITFGADGRVTLRTGGREEKGTYKVDFTKSPPHLDLDWRPGRAGGVLKTVVEFLDDGRLRLEDNAPGNARPAGFSKHSLI